MRLKHMAELRLRRSLEITLVLSTAFSCTPTSAPSSAQIEQQRGTDYKDVRQGIEKSIKDAPQPTAPSSDVPSKSGSDEVVVNQSMAVIKADGSVILPDGPVEIAKYELPTVVTSPGTPVATSLEVTSDSIALTSTAPTKSSPAPAEAPSVAVIEVGEAANGEVPSCSSSAPSDGLKPNTDYLVATCLADLPIGESTTVTTLAKSVEVQSAVITPDETMTKIVLTLPPNQTNVEVAISIVAEGQVKWMYPATGELGLTEEEAYIPVLGKPEDPTVAEVHAATVPKGEFVVQVVTRNKKKMKTAKSKPVLGRGANSALDDRHEGKRTAEQIAEEAEENQERERSKRSGVKGSESKKIVNQRASALRKQLLWLQKDAEQRKMKERQKDQAEAKKNDEANRRLDAEVEQESEKQIEEKEDSEAAEERKKEKAPKKD